ncbi:hypothetical protein PC41400_18950 [Paenibacillus chitinolyticus]|uniref:Uncharacterized protein n=1 Tax=Paenibacillus chitinolyticus TaxID=79263 RepID=A0A410WZ54_9BACL|nr:hypothetical protein [Paenibacillus chitinolyticus]MCY9590381.1 hypothetical protein [Paenibacillus chitinolyticus]MCY9596625.1 hypothetical protein [Paenibacillus chitinolyticus]QAV19630.1 hypothetical protein PC41400_18950 [Paenibacillus chitinolyticus]
MLKSKIVALGVSAVVTLSFAVTAFAAPNHAYTVKGLNTSSATSGYVGGDGIYGRYDAALRQGDNGRVTLYKQRTLLPDQAVDFIDLGTSKTYDLKTYYMNEGTLYYIKATGDNNDEVAGNVWNY